MVFMQILLVSAVSVGLRVTAQDISRASGWVLSWPQDYKRFFMLNPTKHEISTARISHKGLNYEKSKPLVLSISQMLYLQPCNYQVSKSIVQQIKFADIAVM